MTSPFAIGQSAGQQLVERHVGIGEPGDVYGAAAAHDGLDRVVDVPDVDVHAGQHAPATEPERDELPPRDITAEHDLVVGAWLDVSGVLHAEVVLVSKE